MRPPVLKVVLSYAKDTPVRAGDWQEKALLYAEDLRSSVATFHTGKVAILVNSLVLIGIVYMKH